MVSGENVQGLFTGTVGVEVDTDGRIESLPARHGGRDLVSGADRRPGVLLSEVLGKSRCVSASLVWSVLGQRKVARRWRVAGKC